MNHHTRNRIEGLDFEYNPRLQEANAAAQDLLSFMAVIYCNRVISKNRDVEGFESNAMKYSPSICRSKSVLCLERLL
jgi:hypothetical protein